MTCEIRHCDCLDKNLGLPSLEARSVDHILTDPPYSEHTHKAQRQGCTGYVEPTRPGAQRAQFSRNRELGFDYITNKERVVFAAEIARVVKRWVLVFTDDKGLQPWADAFAAAGIEWLRTGVWRKRGSTPQFSGDRPAQGVEFIFIGHRKGRKTWTGGGRHAYWEAPIVLSRSKKDPRVHTTQKPLSLMEALVRDFTDAGDLIVDPFAGSGTTIMAAKRLGCPGLGFEIDETYAELAAARVRDERFRPILAVRPKKLKPQEQIALFEDSA